MRLHSVRWRAVYVAPVRLGLAVVWFFAARLAGLERASDVLAFGGGIFVIVFVAFNDPRMGFVRAAEPEPAPAGATRAGPLEQALAATLPSTVGVSALAAASLAWEPVLTALLGGVSAGLGIAGLLYAVRADPSLWFDPKTKTVYRR
jgi:hypothetical protein